MKTVLAILLIIIPPWFSQYLANIGQDKEFVIKEIWKNIIGNYISWLLVMVSFLWAIVWLKVPCRKVNGPATYYGVIEFPDNGFTYYITSTVVFLICQVLWPELSSVIFWNMPFVIGSLNITGIIFSIYLYMKGSMCPEHPTKNNESSPIFRFYSGTELHPHVFGINVKQLVICRLGLLYWQQFILAFFITGLQRDGFNSGAFANLLIQTIYLARCNYWEEGYFWSLDMMYDRTGYYLCWGALVFLPSIYTYSAYYLVLHPSIISDHFALTLMVIGLLSIAMNARVDYEKLEFKKNCFNSNFKLWGKKVKYIPVSYKDGDGKVIESRLLISGCWGIARHLNYLFELLHALASSLSGLGLGMHSFLCFIFVSGVLVHRCYRDEDRCYKKYGEGYKKYCKSVPYRIIPYIF